MAFVIKKIVGCEIPKLSFKIAVAVDISRFTVEIHEHANKITIHNIRLRESKHYCGNHPYACPIRPGGERPHRHSNCLEGADWVAFNDMLNDVLDSLGVTADVASSLCIIRKGSERRTEYKGHLFPNGIDSEWDKDTSPRFYKNYLMKAAPRSIYPKGTPGNAEWKM